MKCGSALRFRFTTALWVSEWYAADVPRQLLGLAAVTRRHPLSVVRRSMCQRDASSSETSSSTTSQRIGREVYDIAFIMDADGVLLELLNPKLTLDSDMPQAW